MNREREAEIILLGEQLRRHRLGQGLTLKEVGARSGLSVTHVSEVERGRSTPTIGTLAKIADALGAKLGGLLHAGDPIRTLVVGASGNRRELSLKHGSVVIENLLGPDSPFDFSLHILRLGPGASLGERECALGACEEFGCVLDGRLCVHIGSLDFTLDEGDAIHFSGLTAHSLHNPRAHPARVLWVTYPRARW
jgi:transcriptional regulator with XRE-family HTH domain